MLKKSALLLTILFTIFLGFQDSHLQAADADASAKTEVELKINLTKEGHAKLKNLFLTKLKGESSHRTDFYFDIFKEGRYVLQKSSPAIKLRFLWDEQNLTWQTQKTVSIQPHSLFSIKTTEATTLGIKNDTTVLDLIKTYHSHLNKIDPYSLVLAKDIEAILIKNDILDSANKLCPQCTEKGPYYSTHFNEKNRVKVKLFIQEDQFSLQIGETINAGVASYELEAEVKNKSADIHASADRLEKWLLSQGLDSSAIDKTPASDPTLKSAEILRQLHGL